MGLPVQPLSVPEDAVRPEAPRAIPRRRLVDRLDQLATQPLTLVSAPAGFGKSTMLAEWVETRDRAVLIGGRSAPAGPHPDDLRSAAVVVIDETDPVRSALPSAFVEEMISRLGDEVAVVAARRQPWPTRLAVRSGSSVGRIGPEELAFTADEAAELVASIAGGRRVAWPLEDLVDRTGGWATGLVLAAFAARTAGGADLDTVLGEVRPHVEAYLEAEVLSQLDREDRDFLERTALLEELDADVCDSVAHRSGSIRILRRLHRLGVVDRTVARQAESFRRHPLLRDTLRTHLVDRDSAAARRAASVAAEWYLGHDAVEQALQQRAEVGDWAGILDVLHVHGRTLFERGLRRETTELIGAIPLIERRSDRMVLEHAVLQMWVGDSHAAVESLQRLAPHAPPGVRMVANAVTASLVRQHVSAPEAKRAAQAVLDAHEAGVDDLPDVFGLSHPEGVERVARHLRGTASWFIGDLVGARSDLEAALHPLPGYAPWIVRAAGTLALVEAWGGRLRLADSYARFAVSSATRAGLKDHQTTSEARLALAHVERERDRLASSSLHLAAARSIAEQHRESTCLLLVAIEAALLDLAEGRPKEGLESLREWLRAHDTAPVSRFHELARTTQARLLLAMDEPGQAWTLLRSRGPLDAEASAVAVRAALLTRDLDAAGGVLEGWPQRDERRSRLEYELWTAVSTHVRGQRRSAIQLFTDLLPEAAADQQIRLVVDGGRLVHDLVSEVSRDVRDPFVGTLLGAWKSDVAPDRGDGRTGDDLSGRELEVLRFLPSRLSTTEIAANLYVSRNTLKTHLRSIYRKLGARTRDEAVAEAERQGLA